MQDVDPAYTEPFRYRHRRTQRAQPLPLAVATFRAIAALLIGVVPVVAQEAGQKYALLIGVAEYRFTASGITALQYPGKDVTDLAGVLLTQNYRITKLTNEDAKREDIITELDRHAQLVRKQDTFLLYFSGHGVRNRNGRTYWLTYDANLTTLDVAGIRIGHLLDYVGDIKAERKLVLLDHCFSGDVVDYIPSSASSQTTGDSKGFGATSDAGVTSHVEQVKGAFLVKDWVKEAKADAGGQITIAAARAGAFELAKYGHGLLTEALLRAFGSRDADANRDGKLSAMELIEYVPTQVAHLAADAHLPLQQPHSHMGVVDPQLWEIASSLPISDQQEAEDKRDAYEKVMTRWYWRQWISLDVRQYCAELLGEWFNEVSSGGPALSAEKKRILVGIREHLDKQPGVSSDRGREERLAESLKRLIEQELLSPSGGMP